jgi:TonB-linked SusC/RagA family outer membrane protein
LYLFKLFVLMSRQCLIVMLIQVLTLNFLIAEDLNGQNMKETKLSLHVQNESLVAIFNIIQQKTNFVFVYPQNVRNNEQRYSLNSKHESLEKILLKLAGDANLKFKCIHYTITVTIDERLQKADEVKAMLLKTDFSVTGTVTDEAQVTMPGVSVLLKGTTLGTTTDTHGNFALTMPDEFAHEGILIISFIGYKPQEISIQNQTAFIVQLQPDITSLKEIIVVGYGIQKKITSIGAQSTVRVSDLKQPVANLSTSISGRLAGIIGVQRSGEPGYDNAEIYIRGISSFATSASKPLILVDGIERSFNNVDPEDIESFSILKDASATAVYGVRGANGVILINTKKGKEGKPKINVQYSQGITQFTRLPQFVDGVTYMRIANEARQNSNPTALPYYTAEAIQATHAQTDPDLYPDINWFGELFNKTGSNRRVNFNASGGSEMSKYYVGLGYYDERGLFKVDELQQYNSSIGLKRYNFTSNFTLNITNTTLMDFGASGWISDGNYPGTATPEIFHQAYILPPVVHPVKYSDGKIAQQRTADIYNPYHSLTQSGFKSEFRSQLWSNIRLTQKFDFLLHGLSATAMYSFDNYNQHNISRTKTVDRWRAIGRDVNGNLLYEGNAPVQIGTNVLGFSRTNGGSRQFYFESSANYAKKFGKHDVTGMVLYNQTDRTDAFASDFSSSIPYRFHGLAGRVTYAYDERYLLETNFGYNGSEAFSPKNRYGLFPSVGIGWVASNESFFQLVNSYIQFLKFRLSHGTVGNAALSSSGQRFAYISTAGATDGYSFGRNQDNNFSGLDVQYYAANVQWEKSIKSNLGIEVGALRDALSITVDFFRDKRTGIYLVRGDLPEYAGVRNAPTGNLGETFNRGIDGTIEYNKSVGRNIQIGVRGNFTWNRATVVDDANAPWPYPWQQRIGRKLGQRFGYIAEGLFESEEQIENSARQTGVVKPGDIKFKDLNADGVIDSQDQAPIGYGSIPEMVYGIGPMISWKGFSVGAFFKGMSNVDIMLNGDGLVPFQQGVGTRGNLLTRIQDRWTVDNPNPNAFYPRLSDGVNNANYVASSWWTKNGAYLRLQNIEVSYTFPKRAWFTKLGVENLRIFCLGYNVVTWSDFKMWDVEMGDGRGANYPLIKSYSLGVECRFK